MTAYTAGRTGGSYAEGIEVMIRAALQSPHFLYRLEMTAPANASATMVPLSQYELATRLSYLHLGAGPDDALLDAAGRGELADKTAVATKARAMLADSEGARRRSPTSTTSGSAPAASTSRPRARPSSRPTRTPCATG